MKIKIKVKPNSGKQEIVKLDEKDCYVAYLKSVPENGKANIELLKLLQRYFKKEIKMKLGTKGRNKIVEVFD